MTAPTNQKHRNREKRLWRNRKTRDFADREIDRLLEQYERSNELIRKDSLDSQEVF